MKNAWLLCLVIFVSLGLITVAVLLNPGMDIFPGNIYEHDLNTGSLVGPTKGSISLDDHWQVRVHLDMKNFLCLATCWLFP